MSDLEGLSRDALKSRAETFLRQYRNVSQDHAMAIAETQRLRSVIERLGSSEAMTHTFTIATGATGDELKARMEFARLSLLPKDGTKS